VETLKVSKVCDLDREAINTSVCVKIKKSLMKHLQGKFAHKIPWTHPVSGRVFTHEELEREIRAYRNYTTYENWRALWCLWINGDSRSVAASFNFSESTLKRRWDRSLDSILLLLHYPDLKPEEIEFDYGPNPQHKL
jgi:hypothetical protein